jgi:hypothetical protein
VSHGHGDSTCGHSAQLPTKHSNKHSNIQRCNMKGAIQALLHLSRAATRPTCRVPVFHIRPRATLVPQAYAGVPRTRYPLVEARAAGVGGQQGLGAAGCHRQVHLIAGVCTWKGRALLDIHSLRASAVAVGLGQSGNELLQPVSVLKTGDWCLWALPQLSAAVKQQAFRCL